MSWPGSRPDVRRILSIVELGRMHADHGKWRMRILLLQIGQVRQYMLAVDAAIGPEIQKDHLPSQLFQREWIIYVRT